MDRAFLNREASRIKATGKLRGLTLTKYKITRGLNLTDASFEHRIYLLSGLPYVECISVLAHEYAHVWLNERFIEISPMEMEGFCNLISEICLAQDKSKASTLLRENMIQSKDPIYGQGFREMRARLKALGWNQLLAEMLSKSSPALRKGFSFIADRWVNSDTLPRVLARPWRLHRLPHDRTLAPPCHEPLSFCMGKRISSTHFRPISACSFPL